MKKTLFTIATVAFLLTSCQQVSPKEERTEIHNHDHNGMEEDDTKVAPAEEVYICPMKCEGEKTYEEMGKCPVCAMGLEEVK